MDFHVINSATRERHCERRLREENVDFCVIDWSSDQVRIGLSIWILEFMLKKKNGPRESSKVIAVFNLLPNIYPLEDINWVLGWGANQLSNIGWPMKSLVGFGQDQMTFYLKSNATKFLVYANIKEH